MKCSYIQFSIHAKPLVEGIELSKIHLGGPRTDPWGTTVTFFYTYKKRIYVQLLMKILTLSREHIFTLWLYIDIGSWSLQCTLLPGRLHMSHLSWCATERKLKYRNWNLFLIFINFYQSVLWHGSLITP